MIENVCMAIYFVSKQSEQHKIYTYCLQMIANLQGQFINYKNKIKMTTKQKLQDIIYKCDMFSSIELLRYKEEPEYRTLTGGICSLILVSIFCGLFTNVALKTLEKTEIKWSMSTVQSTPDQFKLNTFGSNSNNLIFSLGVSGIDLNNDRRYFDTTMTMITMKSGTSKVKQIVSLEPCQIQDWNFTRDITNAYQRLNFSQSVCPPKNIQIPLEGKFSSEIFKYVEFKISKCTNSSSNSRSCYSEAQIAKKIQEIKTFYTDLYLINTLLNPGSQKFIDHYLEDRNYIPFSLTQRGHMDIFLSKYTFTTDESILPYKTEKVIQGGIINNIGNFISYPTEGNNDFAIFVLRRSSTSLVATREYLKVDETLSYIGGLFGAIMTAMIFMKFYTEFSYEIDVGAHLYNYEKNEPIQPNNFNFAVYLAYSAYLGLSMFGINIEWNYMKKFDQCRQEIQKQFDVRFLFERVIFLERCINILFADHQFKALHLNRKMSLKEAEEIRSLYELKRKLKEDLENKKENDKEIQAQRNNKKDQKPRFQTVENLIVKKRVYPVDQSDHQLSYKTNAQIQLLPADNCKAKKQIRLLRKQSRQDSLSKKIFENLDGQILQFIEAIDQTISQKSQKSENNEKVYADEVKLSQEKKVQRLEGEVKNEMGESLNGTFIFLN